MTIIRIHKDTTAEQLKVYLEAEGMKDVTCRKLPEKPEFRFRTSAFFVSCRLAASIVRTCFTMLATGAMEQN